MGVCVIPSAKGKSHEPQATWDEPEQSSMSEAGAGQSVCWGKTEKARQTTSPSQKLCQEEPPSYPWPLSIQALSQAEDAWNGPKSWWPSSHWSSTLKSCFLCSQAKSQPLREAEQEIWYPTHLCYWPGRQTQGSRALGPNEAVKLQCWSALQVKKKMSFSWHSTFKDRRMDISPKARQQSEDTSFSQETGGNKLGLRSTH